jgi:hypothetical protein
MATDYTVKDSWRVEEDDAPQPSAPITYEVLPGAKPPKVGVNIEWIQKGVGWDCREVYYVGKQRRRRHLGHLGRQKWNELQRQYAGSELEQALREWVNARRMEKSELADPKE